MLYEIPVFNDVQYSCMRCCTLVCFALICRIKVWLYIILVGVLYLILLYTSIATPAGSDLPSRRCLLLGRSPLPLLQCFYNLLKSDNGLELIT